MLSAQNKPITESVDEVFVVHVKKGNEDRKARLDSQFQQLGITPKWMLDADIVDLDATFLNKYIKPNSELYPVRPITSCTVKHLLICESLLHSDAETMLIFEDDILLDTHFLDIFHKIMSEYQRKQHWHTQPIFISIENSTHAYVPVAERVPNQYLYPATKTRCAGAYVINKTTAKAIMQQVEKNGCHLPIDWYYNYLCDQNTIKILWSHPTIVEQGSHNGMMKSAVSKTRYGFYYRLQWWFKKLIKQK